MMKKEEEEEGKWKISLKISSTVSRSGIPSREDIAIFCVRYIDIDVVISLRNAIQAESYL